MAGQDAMQMMNRKKRRDARVASVIANTSTGSIITTISQVFIQSATLMGFSFYILGLGKEAYFFEKLNIPPDLFRGDAVELVTLGWLVFSNSFLLGIFQLAMIGAMLLVALHIALKGSFYGIRCFKIGSRLCGSPHTLIRKLGYRLKIEGKETTLKNNPHQDKNSIALFSSLAYLAIPLLIISIAPTLHNIGYYYTRSLPTEPASRSITFQNVILRDNGTEFRGLLLTCKQDVCLIANADKKRAYIIPTSELVRVEIKNQ